jgi:small subunit ribosomal protein S1
MAILELEDGVMGQLRASEISRDRVEDARTALKIGEEIEARFTGVDRKTRVLSLSIKAKEAQEEQQAMHAYQADSGQTSSSATLGDLLKEQMKSD